MADARILVVGAGVAGLNAACLLAEAGEDILVVDHAPSIGGAIFRRPLAGSHPSILATRRERQWNHLAARLEAASNRVEIRCGTAFAGIDYRGTALVTPVAGGSAGQLFSPRALIVATGATEVVRPRRGWTVPGVSTVGAVQIEMKTSGRAPQGRIVLAGSGPLLLAAGAQLARLGNPPVAIIEAGNPFARPWHAVGLPLRYLVEAAGYMATLMRARVPILSGAQLQDIESGPAGLTVHVRHGARAVELAADRLGLHDGLKRNDLGITPPAGLPFRLAGDCNLCLGADAAVIDGRNAAADILEQLGGRVPAGARATVAAEEAAQKRLARLFAHQPAPSLQSLPADTVLCRCESRTVGDLAALAGKHGADARDTVRDIRLVGRFGMGACQGRFCLDTVSEALGETPTGEALRGSRWPVRPIPIGALIQATDATTDTDEKERKVQP